MTKSCCSASSQRVLQVVQVQHGAGRVAGRAQEQQLAAVARPRPARHRGPAGSRLRRVGVEVIRARRRPAAPRPRRSGRRGWASAPAGAGAARRPRACTNANSASRVPLTGSTMVFRVDARRPAARSAARSQRAMAARSSGRPRVAGIAAQLVQVARASASSTNGGGACCGSPMDSGMCGSAAGGVRPQQRGRRSKG